MTKTQTLKQRIPNSSNVPIWTVITIQRMTTTDERLDIMQNFTNLRQTQTEQ